ncbi:MAG: TauD/TfdA family dioxygenase [Actinomycetota bacterium]|nr:TauD/TfdA family dioxygenase [Actinomycetota bacterium]
MRVVRRHTPFAVELHELDPVEVSTSGGEEIRRLLVEHRVVVIRGTRMAPEQQVALMSLLGRVIREMPDSAYLPYPERVGGKVSYVTTRPGEYISGRDMLSYHSDFSFYRDGAGDAISLYAVEVEGNDPTTFVDMGLAARNMPAPLLERLRRLQLVKCANFFHNADDYGSRYRITDRVEGKDYGNTVSVHPAVIHHPRTGEELVNICQTFTSHVKGWSYEASEDLFAEVGHWQYLPQHTFRHHWQTGDLVIWDNIALQHGRDPLSESSIRHLRRVVTNPWDVEELQQRSGSALDPRLPELQPSSLDIS